MFAAVTLSQVADRRTGYERITFSTFVVILVCLGTTCASADHPAVGYWFVEVSRLTNEVNRAGRLAKVDPSLLDQMAECHGYFAGACDLWIHARTVQVGIKAADDGKTIDYSFSLSRSQLERQPVESHGKLLVRDDCTAKEGWTSEKWVLVLKKNST